MKKENDIIQPISKQEEITLEEIWSKEFWELEAKRIEFAYYDLIKYKIPKGKTTKSMPPTEHRIEKFVRGLSLKARIPNLHVGLTSSDLEDNIRTLRLELSMEKIGEKILALMPKIEAYTGRLMAYTHLLPAGRTDAQHRFLPTTQLLRYKASSRPIMIYRGIKGALGDKAMQSKLGVFDGELDGIFPGKITEAYSHQASNHLTDYEVSCWVVAIGMGLTKLAGDIRMMFALEQAHYEKKDIGSTALAHKAPNPWRFERVCGMFTSIVNLPATVATAGANCLLERTLTDQSVLNAELERGFKTLSNMIKDMEDGLKGLVIKEQRKKRYPTSEEELLSLVLKGEGRLKAHLMLNNKYNKTNLCRKN